MNIGPQNQDLEAEALNLGPLVLYLIRLNSNLIRQ